MASKVDMLGGCLGSVTGMGATFVWFVVALAQWPTVHIRLWVVLAAVWVLSIILILRGIEAVVGELRRLENDGE